MAAHRLSAVIKYVGSKDRLAREVLKLDLIPWHRRYLEPFGGSAEMLLHKAAAPIEVYSDLSTELVEFWRIVQARPNELQARLDSIPYARSSWEWAASNYRTLVDPLEKAVAYFVGRNQGVTTDAFARYGRLQPILGRDLSTMHPRERTYRGYIRDLLPNAQRVKDVTFLNADAFDLIPQYDDPTDLIYLDPPYSNGTRNRPRFEALYEHELLTYAQHLRLLTLVQHSRSMVMLSSYDDDALYHRMLPHWRRVEKEVAVSMRPQNKGRPRRRKIEVVWINPSLATALGARNVTRAA